MRGDLIVLYRVVADADVIFRDELDALCAARGAVLHYLVGDHSGAGRDLLGPAHLLELVPDITERDVFLCGPPAMADSSARTSARHACRAVRCTPSGSPSSDKETPVRKPLTIFLTTLVLTLPAVNVYAAATAPKALKKISSPRRPSPAACPRRIAGATSSSRWWSRRRRRHWLKKSVKRHIDSIKVPVFPDHTDRSHYISQNAIPI